MQAPEWSNVLSGLALPFPLLADARGLLRTALGAAVEASRAAADSAPVVLAVAEHAGHWSSRFVQQVGNRFLLPPESAACVVSDCAPCWGCERGE
jgi:hypothetical protein